MKEPVKKHPSKQSLDSDSLGPQLPERPPIVTFDEWTKEKLKLEELKKNNQVTANLARDFSMFTYLFI